MKRYNKISPHTCYTAMCTQACKRNQERVSLYLPVQISWSDSSEGSITLVALTTQCPLTHVRTLSSKTGQFLHHPKHFFPSYSQPSPCIWETAWGALWVCLSEREGEKGGEEAGQSVRSSGENKESVFCMHRWRQCGSCNNHRFANHLRHLGQRKPPRNSLNTELTQCNSLYWYPCPIHWEVCGTRSRFLMGVASLRIWFCGCRKRMNIEFISKSLSNMQSCMLM